MKPPRRPGPAAERAAEAHLQRAGLRTLAANAHYRLGELDLVMLDHEGDGTPVVVFVEVRYRASASHGGGAGSVDRRKRSRIIRAAQLFLLSHGHWAEAPCRFDVIDASGDPAAPTLAWVRDAFRVGD